MNLARHPAIRGVLANAGICLAWLLAAGCGERAASGSAVTFTRDIAPILFAHCASCHREGQSAPFALLTYAEAAKRARQIVQATHDRYMPPWLPEPGYGEFTGQRLLRPEQIQTLQRWLDAGTPEGDPAALPPVPVWKDGWQLGEPDLVVKMPEPYVLPAEGRDVYRNFVIPLPASARRYVNGVEFRAGSRAIHHAFIRFDRTPESRRRDAQEPGPGFGGLHTPSTAMAPEGFFVSWQPGKIPALERPGYSWTLESGTDLVLQTHLQPTGKAESIQPEIAFYFTTNPPAHTPFKAGFLSFDLDIPAGASVHSITQDYRLPVDADLLAVLPHAHYLARDMQAYATLPDGSRQWLFWIKNWNFNWQGDYAYAQPLVLPKGATISFRYTYDNSAANPRNPHHPPQRTQYGLQSTDEMGELWLQLLPRNPADQAALSRDFAPRIYQNALAYNQYLLRQNPNDGRALTELGKVMLAYRKQLEAWAYLRRAVEHAPDYDEAHYFLGLAFRMRNEAADAIREFKETLRINPAHAKAHGNLAMLYAGENKEADAARHFREALTLNPEDALALNNFALLLFRQGNFAGAEQHLQTALRLSPDDAALKDRIADIQRARAAPPANK